MILQYVSSNKHTYNLNVAGSLVKQANFHTWGWDPVATNLQFGARVSAFRRDPLVYKATLISYGSQTQRKAWFDALHEDFELDVRNQKPGRIYWGDYFIDCYITDSTMAPDKVPTRTGNEIEIYCPHPFWVKPQKRSFAPQASEQQSAFLDYPYDYEYDYYAGDAGRAVWQTGIPFGGEFEMVIYGPAANPRILANNYPYQINVTLAASEYLILNTQTHTITHYQSSGQTANIFDLRDKENSVFEPMPAGDITFIWNGAFGFDLTIFEERSEPR